MTKQTMQIGWPVYEILLIYFVGYNKTEETQEWPVMGNMHRLRRMNKISDYYYYKLSNMNRWSH